MVLIVLKFQRDTGHAHPHRDAAINYTSTLARSVLGAVAADDGVGTSADPC